MKEINFEALKLPWKRHERDNGDESNWIEDSEGGYVCGFAAFPDCHDEDNILYFLSRLESDVREVTE